VDDRADCSVRRIGKGSKTRERGAAAGGANGRCDFGAYKGQEDRAKARRELSEEESRWRARYWSQMIRWKWRSGGIVV
jgi:hypothetical protein